MEGELPGEILRRELEQRGWTQQDLADIMGCSLRLVNEVVTGRRSISAETAIMLASALGTTPHHWMQMESAYQLARIQKQSGPVERRAKLFAVAPVNEMIRRHWIAKADTYDELEARVLRFMDMKHVDDVPVPIAHAARKATEYGVETPAQRAWLCRAYHLAQAAPAGSFTKRSIDKALDGLHRLTHEEEEIRLVPRVLQDAGIRFLVIEHLAGTKIDGASFWLHGSLPVVVLTLRYGRIDCFWHTLIHELMHLKEGPTRGPAIDLDMVGEDGTGVRPESEKVIDQQAAAFLVPPEKLESFIRRTHPLYPKKLIRAFAHTVQVHPGIVVGQLQNRKVITFSQHRDMLTTIRKEVIFSTLTDGWGQQPNINLH